MSVKSDNDLVEHTVLLGPIVLSLIGRFSSEFRQCRSDIRISSFR